MTKAKAVKSPKETSVQEEMTALGTIVNLLKMVDPGARARMVEYLTSRFGDYDSD